MLLEKVGVFSFISFRDFDAFDFFGVTEADFSFWIYKKMSVCMSSPLSHMVCFSLGYPLTPLFCMENSKGSKSGSLDALTKDTNSAELPQYLFF